eukprot:TRINITY_DN11404_c0_g1_i1.p1 TRINITY_DN11404_c0_g1~~TRINITY_DN11404_c0_g1_i1.p1  ORF type:complete len:977 (-),score=170.98 TRINITY_DN11404_c0_g1_i1:13-2943(-)
MSQMKRRTLPPGVRVRINSASNLPLPGLGEAGTIVVRASVAGTTLQTKPSTGSRHAKWNETVRLPVADPMTDVLQFVIADISLGKDTEICRCELLLGDLHQSRPQDFSLNPVVYDTRFGTTCLPDPPCSLFINVTAEGFGLDPLLELLVQCAERHSEILCTEGLEWHELVQKTQRVKGDLQVIQDARWALTTEEKEARQAIVAQQKDARRSIQLAASATESRIDAERSLTTKELRARAQLERAAEIQLQFLKNTIVLLWRENIERDLLAVAGDREGWLFENAHLEMAQRLHIFTEESTNWLGFMGLEATQRRWLSGNINALRKLLQEEEHDRIHIIGRERTLRDIWRTNAGNNIALASLRHAEETARTAIRKELAAWRRFTTDTLEILAQENEDRNAATIVALRATANLDALMLFGCGELDSRFEVRAEEQQHRKAVVTFCQSVLDITAEESGARTSISDGQLAEKEDLRQEERADWARCMASSAVAINELAIGEREVRRHLTSAEEDARVEMVKMFHAVARDLHQWKRTCTQCIGQEAEARREIAEDERAARHFLKSLEGHAWKHFREAEFVLQQLMHDEVSNRLLIDRAERNSFALVAAISPTSIAEIESEENQGRQDIVTEEELGREDIRLKIYTWNTAVESFLINAHQLEAEELHSRGSMQIEQESRWWLWQRAVPLFILEKVNRAKFEGCFLKVLARLCLLEQELQTLALKEAAVRVKMHHRQIVDFSRIETSRYTEHSEIKEIEQPNFTIVSPWFPAGKRRYSAHLKIYAAQPESDKPLLRVSHTSERLYPGNQRPIPVEDSAVLPPNGKLLPRLTKTAEGALNERVYSQAVHRHVTAAEEARKKYLARDTKECKPLSSPQEVEKSAQRMYDLALRHRKEQRTALEKKYLSPLVDQHSLSPTQLKLCVYRVHDHAVESQKTQAQALEAKYCAALGSLPLERRVCTPERKPNSKLLTYPKVGSSRSKSPPK